MSSIKTRRGFEKLSATELSKMIGKTDDGFTDNPDLPEPPVPPVELAAKKSALDDAIIKAVKGGSLATARRNAIETECVIALNKNASYVDIVCDDDLPILLSSGYEAVSTNRAPRVLNAPQILAVETKTTGQLQARIKADTNSRSFVGRIKSIDGEFGPTISFASSRKIVFAGLTAGIVYVFELMAIGGSNGQSNWSSPGTGMAL